jgi:HEPN pEK499 p136
MGQSITQEDNLILQTYYTFILLMELGDEKNNFLNSDYYNRMQLDLAVRQGLNEITVQNQGSLLMALYAMLVIPKELLEKEYKNEYKGINTFLRGHIAETITSYPKEDETDLSSIDFVRHIRNSVSHARVSFEPHQFIMFIDRRVDQNGDLKAEFSTKLPLAKVGEFLNELQKVHLKYIENRRKLSEI